MLGHLPISRNNQEINSKRSLAFSMRQEQKSFAEIATFLGLSESRARSLVKEAEKVAAHGESWVDGLSTFMAGSLIKGGYTCIEDVLKALDACHDQDTMPDLFWRSHGINKDLDTVGAKRIRELGIWVSDALNAPNH
jgi:hypothetical protein